MINTAQTIELLAPAKDKDCAIAAINAGADAVYIGASDYGARKKAGNSIDDIREIVNYAHKFSVKVYVTLNTILYDDEIKSVEKLVKQLYEIGVDAIIFQDFSFFKMDLPPIALHASTQCNNDDLEKIKFLKSMNVERVVLPREFSITQIKEVTSSIDIETEVFIHGALCVSYSGQCYLSHHIGGRSANRGECAQPCRKKYSLIDEKGKVILAEQYLLSMKDNNQSEHLKELIEAGVTSLKIEGRLKDKEYVENITAYYRKLIDDISKDLRPSVGELSNSDFEADANKTFNRTYTDFYIDGARKTFINPKTPKFTGQYAGQVKSVSGKVIKLDKKIKLNVSDKLCYFNKDKDLSGTTVTRILGNDIEVLNIGEIKAGTKLFRNFDSEYNKKLANADFKRKLPIKFEVTNSTITIESCTGSKVEIPVSNEYETANNIEKAIENIKKQLSKLGDTDFVCKEVVVSEDFEKFIPISSINELRRTAVKELESAILKDYKITKRTNPTALPVYPYKTLDYSFNVSNKLAKEFYESCDAEVSEQAPECGTQSNNIALMTTKHCLRDFAGICTKKVKNTDKLFLVDEQGAKYPLEFDCKNCVMKVYQKVD